MNFTTWKAKGLQYVAVDRGDGWHIVREDGGNFGAWRGVPEFRAMQAKGDPNGFLPLPDCKARLRVQAVVPDER
jgi:hypothetical protein